MTRHITICFLLFAVSYWPVQGQGIYNKGAVMSIATETLLVVPDSLVNDGTLVNNGDLRISGAWINNGTYDAGAGQINFNGNVVQTINHNDQSFENLVISGDGEKLFQANITIESGLDLAGGLLKSANGAKIILNTGATVTGGSDLSHVVGPVEVKGAGNWLFPIGDGTTYLPVEISGVTDPGASATIIMNEPASGLVLTGTPELARLSSRRYWELVVGGGSLNQAKVRLALSNDDGLATSLGLLVVAESAVPTGPYSSIGQSAVNGDLASGSLTSEATPTRSFLAVGALVGDRSIEVFNGVSVVQDGLNDWMRIRNIEFYPGNRVTIFNRWGDPVFEMSGYDNDTKNFRGESNVNGSAKLPAGTYFYSVNLGDGSPKTTGYVQIK